MAAMATLPLGLVVFLNTRVRVHVHLTSHDETVLEQLADVLSGISESDLSDFIGVNPDSLEADLENVGGKSLLKLQGCHI